MNKETQKLTFDQQVLLVVKELQDTEQRAFGLSVFNRLGELGINVINGSVYNALDRLEEKGLLRSEFTKPLAERGNRRKKIYFLEEKGLVEVNGCCLEKKENQSLIKKLVNKFIPIVLITTLHLTTLTALTACAQTRMNNVNSNKEQAGNVLFIAPKNWQRLDKDSGNGQTIFVAPGANQSTVITILPGEQLSGSLQSWFEGFLAKNHSNSKVVRGGQIVKGSSDEGYEVVLAEETLQASDGAISYRFYVAAHPNNRAEVIALISTDYKEYQQYKSVFDQFVQSLDFANLKNSSSKSSNSKSDNKNVTLSSISSNALSGLFVGTTSRQQFNPNSKVYDYIIRQQYYLFAPNGRVYFGLPKADIRNIDLACQQDSANCGQYSLEGNQLQLIRQGQPQSFNLEKSNNGFKLGSTRFYPVGSFDGLRLNGTYSFRSFTNLSGGAGGVSGGVSGERSISFSSDGQFIANNFVGFAASGGVSGAASTTTSNGQGSYQINGNTLILVYSNGQQEQFSFFVYPENESESRPGLVVIGGVSYLIRN